MKDYDENTVKTNLIAINNTKSHIFLMDRVEDIADFSSVDEMVSSLIENPTNKSLKAFEYHFLLVRNDMLKVLWGVGLYLSRALVEEILFIALKCNNPLLHEEVISVIQNNNIHEPCILVYPLHSFGVDEGAGLFQFVSRKSVSIEMKSEGVIIYPQSNNENELYNRIRHAMKSFSINGALDEKMLMHYLRSRPLKWTHKNPVMLVRARTFQWDYFSNHFAIKLKLTLTKAYVIFLHLHGKRPFNRNGFTSTSKINNFETLDIKHYLILQPNMKDNNIYDVNCVPINSEPNDMADLSELCIDLNPSEWTRRKKYTGDLKKSFDQVERGIVNYCYFKINDRNRKTVYLKLKNSILYFNKSFRKADKNNDAVVMLSIAFETLLLDNYASGIGAKLDKRVRLSLKGTKGCKKYWNKIDKLYSARCEIVHSGETNEDIDMKLCQEAFSRCWQKIALLVENLSSASVPNPIGELIGDF